MADIFQFAELKKDSKKDLLIMTGDTQVPLLGSCRLVLTVMVFFGVYHLMALRFNLSMALGKSLIDINVSS